MDKRRSYTPEEDEYIRQHYAAALIRDIAAELGRTPKSIQRRSEKIECPRKKPIRRFTEEEDQIILASKGRPLATVAEELGRDPSDLLKRAHKLGFHSWRRPDNEPMYFRGYKIRCHNNGKRVYEHRAVVEELIGRKLTSDERVHHIDLVKTNNRPENLFLFACASDHVRCHHTLDGIVEKNADVAELLRVGAIRFDRNEGVYRCGNQK